MSRRVLLVAVICSVLSLFSLSSSSGQEGSLEAAPAEAIPPVSPSTTEPLGVVDEARDVVRLETIERDLGLIREFNDDLFAVVCWSLGAVLLMTVTLVGYNFYSTHHLEGRREELLAASLRSALEAQLDEGLGRIEGQLRDLVQERARKIEADLQSQFDHIERQLLLERMDSLRLEAEAYKERGFPQQAFRLNVSYLEQARKYGNKGFINLCLDRMEKVLPDALKHEGGLRLDSDDLQRATEQLRSLESDYPIAASLLKQLFSSD